MTYLTLLNWDPRTGPDVPGVHVLAVAPELSIYVKGRRSIGAQLRFALGVFRHLVLHGGRYDVVQTPALHLSLIAVLAARAIRRYGLVVDWFEVWRRDYWLEYVGPLWGRLGWLGQRLTVRSPQTALCFSRLHADRLRTLGFRGQVTLIEALRSFDPANGEPAPAEPLVVFAGRHIPEKRPTAVVLAVATAREQLPELRAEIFGDGPERDAVLRLIDEHGLDDVIHAPGFADADRVQAALRRALCLVHPSVREDTASSWSRRPPSARRSCSSTSRTTQQPSSWRPASTASSQARPSRTSWLL